MVETGQRRQAGWDPGVLDEQLLEALHVVERLVRSPEVLANILEAAGPLTLERAGALLNERVPG